MGKIVILDEPLLITKKTVLKSDDANENDSISKSFHVEAIIKRKLIFNTRPKPIIGNFAKKS